MYRSTRYVMLIASLPHLGALFSARQTPLSRFRLEQRLNLLDKEDAALLAHIEQVIHWEKHQQILLDAEILRRAQQLINRLGDQHHEQRQLRQLIEWRLELRTLIAALRRRRQGQPTPHSTEAWGYGRWTGHIQRYWREPDFRLQGVYPWITDAEKFLQTDDSLSLERLILSIIWEQLGRAQLGHQFDFVAVTIYVLRWNIVNRWTSYNRVEAQTQLNTLIDAGLGRFARLDAPAAPEQQMSR